MSDTAAFFAKKKTKKKKFKSFNANKIDASTVSASTHVDAPEISAENVTTSLGGLGLAGTSAGAETNGDDQWADSQAGWGSNNNTTATPSSGADSKVAELLDMRALNAKRNEQDDVAERFRIEETKAKLARAKEGMAKEAERLAAEKEFKAVGRGGNTSAGRTGGSSALGGGTGGKWVPAHMRSTGAGGASGGSRFGMAARGPASMDGSGFQKPVDMANEELFPDLAAADKILADKEEHEKEARDRMATGKSKAPAGWGSRLGSGSSAAPAAAAPAQRKPLNLVKPPAERKPLNLASSNKNEEESEAKKEETTEETKPAAAAEATTAEAPAPVAAAATPATATPAPAKKVLKKKKKKDLSTFKPKS
eukprot:CAMPEP_0172309726 /NCGR_PEP_ID=MMETSP1058-20130122/10514_1 /TAXON_ID=83371 /ORGANISM="Detonula confervacea, Strain CCMP 353" /LENGTH=365 /DNA_ID=CAMNT_0013022401 /DNA_START=50 /DNA_END=1147 /DNA_ORIENTATION=+